MLENSLFLLGVVSQNLTMSGIVYTMGAGIGVLASAQILMNVFVIFAMVCAFNVLHYNYYYQEYITQ